MAAHEYRHGEDRPRLLHCPVHVVKRRVWSTPIASCSCLSAPAVDLSFRGSHDVDSAGESRRHRSRRPVRLSRGGEPATAGREPLGEGVVGQLIEVLTQLRADSVVARDEVAESVSGRFIRPTLRRSESHSLRGFVSMIWRDLQEQLARLGLFTRSGVRSRTSWRTWIRSWVCCTPLRAAVGARDRRRPLPCRGARGPCSADRGGGL